MAGNHAIAREFLFLHPEIGRAVDDKLVELLKTVVVQEKLDPFAGRHFARSLLFFEPRLAAAFFGDARPFLQKFDLAFCFRFGLHIA